MARLSARGRKRISGKNFVYPKQRKYPIHDKSHAKSALRMAGRKDTFGSLATVKKKVYQRYPSLKPSS